MKAEPNSRVVKGKDVKFSVDDFEAVKTTAWEGVRNHEAKNLIKEMKIGDKVLFYHSNCKHPGIAGFAEVAREAYPDSTAWDPQHPYYDTKSDPNNPKWYMVDLVFSFRAAHFVPLELLRHIADSSPPSELAYLQEDDIEAIKGMALVSRGRLSVQRVDAKAFGVIVRLANNGGWEAMKFSKRKLTKPPTQAKTTQSKRKREEEDDDANEQEENETGSEYTQKDSSFGQSGSDFVQSGSEFGRPTRKGKRTPGSGAKRKTRASARVVEGTRRSTRRRTYRESPT